MLKITETGGDRVRFKINTMAARAKNLTPAYKTFGEYRARRHTAIFNSQRSPYDEKWTALKPATIAKKRKKGSDPRILHDSLKMRGSFYTKPTARKIEWGYSVPYIRYHVKGTRRLPIRSPLEDKRGLAPRDMKRYKKLLAEYLLND
jgi:hypothetical protein